MTEPVARYPGRAPIEAYGNGGFRFAGMSHRGSILCLPAGIIAWSATDVSEITPAFAAMLQAKGLGTGTLLLGTGRMAAHPAPDVAAALRSLGIWFEVMDTGAAARTFNVLLAEERDVSAALIAVEG